MADFPIPDEASLRDLGEMLTWWRQQKRVPASRSVRPEPPGEPLWAYLVLVPDEGIEALDVAQGSGTGTGTGDNPGEVNCQVWKHTADVGGNGLIYAGFDILVNNFSDTAIPGGIYVLATRDAFGQWWTGLPIQTTEC